jgi:hypothetical protein
MARTILNSILSFLSTAVFFATFALAGDVLLAATAAIAAAFVQFVVRRSTQHRTGVLMWASLALVLALTGLSLKGDEAFAASMPQAQIGHRVTGHVAQCGCRMPANLTEAKLSATPAL